MKLPSYMIDGRKWPEFFKNYGLSILMYTECSAPIMFIRERMLNSYVKSKKDINNSPVKSPITQNMLIKQPIERCRTNQYTIDGISNKTKRKTIKDGMYNFLREKGLL